MPSSIHEKRIAFCLRIAMAWIFLYAGIRQVFAPEFSIVGFLGRTQTFHDFFALFTGPGVAPLLSGLVAYGHLLIGLSLLAGLMVRPSAVLGAFLMVLYWAAHMDWPYIESKANFIVDQHLVFVGVLAYLYVVRAGHIWGLDAWVGQTSLVQALPRLKRIFA